MNMFRVLGHSYNDPYFHLQHNLRAIRIEEAHRWTTGKGVTVAVVDTGVDASHPDLRDRITHSDRYVEMNRPAVDAHGTAVAGVIVASANNEIGIVGVAPHSKVMSLNACSVAGGGASARCNSLSLLMALETAIMERAQVLNLSLAGPDDPLIERLIVAATKRGITVVAACDEQAEDISFPASLDEVIAVRSVDPDGKLRGSLRGDFAVELAAPGVDVLTTVPGRGYDFVTGSSFAAAHLSGVVALLHECKPDLSPAEVAALLRSTADARMADSTASRNGATIAIVNVCAALAKLTGHPMGRTVIPERVETLDAPGKE
jgi:subtilisin family serine protease